MTETQPMLERQHQQHRRQQRIRLGVNIDHVATLRQQRHTRYPDVLQAGLIAEQAGADLITVHLREDRRHIQDKDVFKLKEQLSIPLNLEMALTEAMLANALQVKPAWVCLVPEKRQELTTEGGLDAIANQATLQTTIARLQQVGCKVSLFLDADLQQLDCARQLQSDAVELHTGSYADHAGDQQTAELQRLQQAAAHGANIGLQIHAGHGLHVDNVAEIARIPAIEELNIGHAIVADAVFMGLDQAIKRMRDAMDAASR